MRVKTNFKEMILLDKGVYDRLNSRLENTLSSSTINHQNPNIKVDLSQGGKEVTPNNINIDHDSHRGDTKSDNKDFRDKNDWWWDEKGDFLKQYDSHSNESNMKENGDRYYTPQSKVSSQPQNLSKESKNSSVQTSDLFPPLKETDSKDKKSLDHTIITPPIINKKRRLTVDYTIPPKNVINTNSNPSLEYANQELNKEISHADEKFKASNKSYQLHPIESTKRSSIENNLSSTPQESMEIDQNALTNENKLPVEYFSKMEVDESQPKSVSHEKKLPLNYNPSLPSISMHNHQPHQIKNESKLPVEYKIPSTQIESDNKGGKKKQRSSFRTRAVGFDSNKTPKKMIKANDCEECSLENKKQITRYEDYRKLGAIPKSIHFTISYLCTICDENFDNRYKLEKHMRDNHDTKSQRGINFDNKYFCNMCNDQFESKKALDRHKKNIHDAFSQTEKGIKRKFSIEYKPKKQQKSNYEMYS